MSERESEIRETIRRHATHVRHPCELDDAVRAMEQFGSERNPAIIDVLVHGDDDQKIIILQLLRDVQPKTVEFVPVLIGLLNEDRLIKMTAAETLGYFEAVAVEAIPAIERTLDSEDGFLRCLSAGAILRIAPDHDRAYEVLHAALESEDGASRRHAEHYLSEN